jgi:hypothetical protein
MKHGIGNSPGRTEPSDFGTLYRAKRWHRICPDCLEPLENIQNLGKLLLGLIFKSTIDGTMDMAITMGPRLNCETQGETTVLNKTTVR